MASFSYNSVVLLFLMRHKFQGKLCCITRIAFFTGSPIYTIYYGKQQAPLTICPQSVCETYCIVYRYIKCSGFYNVPVQRCVTLPSINCRPFASEVV